MESPRNGRTAEGFVRSRLSIVSPFVPAIVKRQVLKFELLQRVSSEPDTTGLLSARELTADFGGTTTPPPSYAETLSPLTSTSDTEDEVVIASGSSARASAAVAAAAAFQEQDSNGIQWKYAGQGLNLLSLSVQESSSSQPFSRQLYMHALTYLLRGLPEDLTREETCSLQSAVPPSLSTVQTDRRSSDPTMVHDSSEHRGAEHTILHRLARLIILQLFMFVAFIVPHLQTFLAAAYSYERENHIAERLFAQTLGTADELGKWSLGLANGICGLHGGKVGKLIEQTLAWWIQGIFGGVHEGVGEGMRIMGLNEHRQGNSRRR